MAALPRMILVTGKGGTGKSTVAAALALKYARQGKRVQLIELGNRSFFAADGGTLPVDSGSASRSSLLAGVTLLTLDPLASLKEYVKRFALFESAANLLLDSKPARSLLNTLPGLKELAIIGKLTHCLELDLAQGGYDLTVVDCFSSGHLLALLRAPLGLAESIHSGPLGRQCRKMLTQLQDPAACRFIIVTLPEELPLAESLELSASLEKEFAIRADYLCNKLLVDMAPIATAGEDRFADYIDAWQQRQRRVLAALEEQRAVARLPYCFDLDLKRQLETLADAL